MSSVDRTVGLAAVCGGVLLAVVGWRLDPGTSKLPGPGFFPLLIAVTMGALGLRLLLRPGNEEPTEKHGFIGSQKEGREVFRRIDPDAPIIVAEAVWQYSHHVLPGLSTHRGPILTAANWSGTWPGLVGMLNLNGSLTKAGVRYSSLWSEDFTDDFFVKSLRSWLNKGKVSHKTDHITPYDSVEVPGVAAKAGAKYAQDLLKNKAIMGIFDEGCMGMYNAIIDDGLLNPAGVYKERLSQSALVAAMRIVSPAEAQAVRDWLNAPGRDSRGECAC